MPASLLRSQFDTLEEPTPDEPGVVTVDAGGSAEEEVAAVIAALDLSPFPSEPSRVARLAGRSISPADVFGAAPLLSWPGLTRPSTRLRSHRPALLALRGVPAAIAEIPQPRFEAAWRGWPGQARP